MSYDARQIANWFVNQASKEGKTLSIMTLLKLVYVAHGWHLEVFKTPLFKNRIEAWKLGPVIPDVYNAFRPQGVDITAGVPFSETRFETEDESLLCEIYNIYGHMDGFQLSNLTHEPNGPWDIATKQRGHFAVISDELIQQHYEIKRQNAQSAN